MGSLKSREFFLNQRRRSPFAAGLYPRKQLSLEPISVTYESLNVRMVWIGFWDYINQIERAT